MEENGELRIRDAALKNYDRNVRLHRARLLKKTDGSKRIVADTS